MPSRAHGDIYILKAETEEGNARGGGPQVIIGILWCSYSHFAMIYDFTILSVNKKISPSFYIFTPSFP